MPVAKLNLVGRGVNSSAKKSKKEKSIKGSAKRRAERTEETERSSKLSEPAKPGLAKPEKDQIGHPANETDREPGPAAMAQSEELKPDMKWAGSTPKFNEQPKPAPPEDSVVAARYASSGYPDDNMLLSRVGNPFAGDAASVPGVASPASPALSAWPEPGDGTKSLAEQL